MIRRTRNAELAADLAAETFAGILEAAGRFDPTRLEGPSAIPWIISIARYTLLASLRRGVVAEEARRRLEMEPMVLDDAALARVEEAGGDGPLLGLLHDLPATCGRQWRRGSSTKRSTRRSPPDSNARSWSCASASAAGSHACGQPSFHPPTHDKGETMTMRTKRPGAAPAESEPGKCGGRPDCQRGRERAPTWNPDCQRGRERASASNQDRPSSLSNPPAQGQAAGAACHGHGPRCAGGRRRRLRT